MPWASHDAGRAIRAPARVAFLLREHGRHIGIGIGSYVEGTGLGPFEGVTVRVQENGKVLVKSGAAPQGQGHQTMFQQIVAGSPTLSDELSTVATNIEEPGRLVDFIASSLPST